MTTPRADDDTLPVVAPNVTLVVGHIQVPRQMLSFVHPYGADESLTQQARKYHTNYNHVIHSTQTPSTSMSTLPHPCLECGQLTRNQTRCKTCDNTNHNKAYGNKWRKHSQRQRQQHPKCQCRGCNLHTGPCNTTTDLTVDHLLPHSRGGTPNDGTRTLCRPCNSSRSDRPL